MLQRPSKARFRLPVEKSDALELLRAAYKNEVEYRGFTYSPSAETQIALDIASDWLTGNTKTGLIIMGTPGNGKTTLAKAIQRLINAFRMKDEYERYIDMRFRTAKDIVQMSKEQHEAYKNICHTPLLTIDDFGEEQVDVLDYGNVTNPMIDLLSIRYSEQLPTVLTTNIGPDRIRQNYGDRIADRFNEFMRVVIIRHSSYRK